MSLADGIYYDLPEAEYHKLPRLSSHGIAKLLINPHDYWVQSFMNPDKKERKSKAFSTGKIYEVVYLEGAEKFRKRFCPKFDGSKFPGALDTVPEIKEAIEKLGVKPKGNKPELVQQLIFLDPSARVLCELENQWAADNEGKEIIDLEDYDNALASYTAMQGNPLDGARTQVAVLWTDEETGVPMRALIDAETDDEIWDVKTFSNPRDMNINRLISMHICNYGYYRQLATYDMAMPGKELKMLFVQTGGSYAHRAVNFSKNLLLFRKGQDEVRRGINLFRDCYEQFGADKPWIVEPSVISFKDEDFPMYIYNDE